MGLEGLIVELIIFGVFALLACLFVLWMGQLFGMEGALSSSAVVSSIAIVLWVLRYFTTHPSFPRWFLERYAAVPLITGAVIGLLLSWGFWGDRGAPP
jgi:hypothetical protein